MRYDGGELQIWIDDLERGVPEPLVTEGPSFDPHWRPDGRSLTFTTQRRGNFDLWNIAADGSSPAASLIATPADEGGLRWAPDGVSAILEFYSENGRDLWGLLDGKTRPLLETPADDTPIGFSREGQWMAYLTAGAVYVARWPDLGGRVLIAPSADSDGGVAWSKQSDELFYVFDGRMMAVPFTVEGGDLRPGAARELFELPANTVGSNFDTGTDGRFLVRLRVEEPPDELIRVVLGERSLLPGVDLR